MGIGRCCCKKCSPILVDEYENVTKVLPYATGATAPIAPYARGWYQISSTGCQLLSMYPPDCGDTNQPVCYTHGFDNVGLAMRENVTGIVECTGDGGEMVSQVINNCFRKTGNKVSIERTGQRCGMGWKGCQSQSVWSGRFGYLLGGNCCDEPAQETPQFKYTTIECKNTSSFVEDTRGYNSTDGPTTSHGERSHDFLQNVVCDEYGNITRTGHKRSKHYEENTTSGVYVDVEDNCDGSGSGHNSEEHSDGSFAGNIEIFPGEYDPLWECGVGGTPETFEVPFNQTYSVGSPAYLNCEYIVNDWHQEFSVSDNLIKYEFRADLVIRKTSTGYDTFYGSAGTVHSEYKLVARQDITFTLSGSRAYADVLADCKALLNEWNLNDHAQYPWRTDAKTWLQPLVTRDAAATQPYIDWTVDGECRFRQQVLYTGAIKGSPTPAGYGRFFNFTHINWERGETNGGTTCSACEVSLGSASPAEIPASATQWTNNFDGSQAYGPGGHVSQFLNYNYGTGSPGPTPIDGVWMQKWCETAEAWPKQNEARPCGIDRWLRDEDDGQCVVSLTLISGSNYELTLEYSPPGGGYASGDKIGLDDGIYNVTSGSGIGPYTVTKIHDLPDWVEWEGCAKMSNYTARAICGRIMPTSITQSAPGEITVVLPRKHWLRLTGDTVSFIDVPGLGTSVAATYVDETTFTVPGTLGAYLGAGYVHSPGTTETDWNKDTTCAEHKFVVQEWRSDYRDNPGESIASKALVEYDYAAGNEPFILCVSPNSSDTPISGVIYDFEDIEADMCFGEEWHKVFTQAIVDPYWSATKKGGAYVDCSSAECVMNSAPCAGDGCYKHYPLVEPTLATVPDSDAPGAVLAPWCETEPNARATVHNIRAAWEECDEWKDMINANCGSRGY